MTIQEATSADRRSDYVAIATGAVTGGAIGIVTFYLVSRQLTEVI
jgi:hypothetical protein